MHPGELLAAAGVVLDDHLADAADAEHLGLRGGPCDHEPDPGNLRGRVRCLAPVVTSHTRRASRGTQRSLGLMPPDY